MAIFRAFREPGTQVRGMRGTVTSRKAPRCTVPPLRRVGAAVCFLRMLECRCSPSCKRPRCRPTSPVLPCHSFALTIFEGVDNVVGANGS